MENLCSEAFDVPLALSLDHLRHLDPLIVFVTLTRYHKHGWQILHILFHFLYGQSLPFFRL